MCSWHIAKAGFACSSEQRVAYHSNDPGRDLRDLGKSLVETPPQSRVSKEVRSDCSRFTQSALETLKGRRLHYLWVTCFSASLSSYEKKNRIFPNLHLFCCSFCLLSHPFTVKSLAPHKEEHAVFTRSLWVILQSRRGTMNNTYSICKNISEFTANKACLTEGSVPRYLMVSINILE